MCIIFAPVNGNWTRWSDWNNCTLQCGGGTQNRSRTCTDPHPQYGGDECVGDAVDVQICNNHKCPGTKILIVTVSALNGCSSFLFPLMCTNFETKKRY